MKPSERIKILEDYIDTDHGNKDYAHIRIEAILEYLDERFSPDILEQDDVGKTEESD